ncbi:hypothetical protein ACHAXR_008766 [Thalassiosira sp. AJA248-18]
MHSQSIDADRVTEEEQTLRPTAPVAGDDPEQCHGPPCNEVRQRQIGQAGDSVVDASKPVVQNQSNIGYEEPIMLSHSTHSFLFTEPTCSVPFCFGLFILLVSYTCLLIALLNNILADYTSDNPFNIPIGVAIEVQIAQYLALMIGLLMEEEIPESLYLLRMITEKTLKQQEPNMRYRNFIFCALLRIIMASGNGTAHACALDLLIASCELLITCLKLMIDTDLGYLFYLNMFTVVAQATSVIDIFFDVLALQFLQQLDDIAFRLAKMDVFGKRIKRASVKKCFRAEFEKLPFARRKKMSVFVKLLYVFNLCAMMVGMALITIRQRRGDYNCKSISVQFDDAIWEDAFVLNSTGGIEEWDLLYSYFNGVYVKNGTHEGRAVYVEQNKFDDTEYRIKTGAVIKYCKEEGAWVFMHDHIRKDKSRKSSDCPWLLRSPDTTSFNLLEVSGDWSIWTGIINTGATFQTICNHCKSEADCNYHGQCIEKECVCDVNRADGFRDYNGMQCQFPRPCFQLSGNEGDLWNIVPMKACDAWTAYGRGVYKYYSGGNMTNTGQDDFNALVYTGSRWFATVFEDGELLGIDYWMQSAAEVHAFWDKVYTKNTAFVSNPTSRTDPIAVDFFRIGRTGAKYGPLGELIPLQEPPGSGYFDCSGSLKANEFVSDVLGRPDCANFNRTKEGQ